MKTKILILWLPLFVITKICGQITTGKSIASFDIGAFYTRAVSTGITGYHFSINYFLSSKVTSGFSCAVSQKKIHNDFSFSVNKPVLNYYELGWINQYYFLSKSNFKLNLNLDNGLFISRLGDNQFQEIYYTRYGYQRRSKRVAENYDYFVEPGVDFSIRLFPNSCNYNVFLTQKIKYRYVFGNTKFSETGQFNGYFLSLGLSLVGYEKKR